ncbi:hypothetical protein Adt_20756 [Abeliophyllum distichum]|uniref:Uncharacterized protein n=1 Tax=Abeliophyllum distichum TaxID=126358 RepID=A0ABD1SXE6_9LAMI
MIHNFSGAFGLYTCEKTLSGSSEEEHQKKTIEEISHDAAHEEAKHVASAVGTNEGEEVVPLIKRPKGDMDDLLKASIACSIRAASTSMRSLNAVKEYKKKMAGEAANVAEFHAAMDGLTAMAESAKAVYQQMNEILVEAEGNIAALTKRLDDAFAAQAITASALDKANEEKKALQLSSQSEVALLKAELEAIAKAWLDSEDAYVRILAERKAFEEKLINAEMAANFYNT